MKKDLNNFEEDLLLERNKKSRKYELPKCIFKGMEICDPDLKEQ